MKANFILKLILFSLAIAILLSVTFERDLRKINNTTDCKSIYHDNYKKRCYKRFVDLKRKDCVSIKGSPLEAACHVKVDQMQREYERQSGSWLKIIIEIIPLIFVSIWAAGFITLPDRYFMFLKEKSETEILFSPLSFALTRMLVLIAFGWLYELLLYHFVWN